MKTPDTQPNKRSGVDKVNALCEFANVPEEKQGEFIRSQGLHLTHLQQWRQQAEDALSEVASKRQKRQGSSQEHKRQMQILEKENKRLQAAVAEGIALLVVNARCA
jgi:hypothetical protein